MQFSVKQWRDTRPESLKACGVAEAIDKVNDACRFDPRDMTTNEELLAASRAVEEFLAALDKAKGKLKTKGSHDGVKSLLRE